MKTNIIPYEAYCSSANQRMGPMNFGAWSFILVYNNEIIFETYGSEEGSNQRMELQATLKAIEKIEKIKSFRDPVIIYSTSSYLLNCYNQEWYRDWIKNGWRTKGNKEIANSDLWYKIIPFFKRLDYHFTRPNLYRNSAFQDKSDFYAKREAKKAREDYKRYE